MADEAPFVGWALASILLGLGFTFFSGATEAWLVDALVATGFTGNLESVFGRAQAVGGAAMLVGSVTGGVVAQLTSLGVPYLLRAAFLGVTLVVAFRFMHDIGFTPDRGANPVKAVRTVWNGALDGGLRNPPVRWLMLAAPFTTGVGFYVFYAIQPYLLQLYGDPNAYSIAGLAAALFAGRLDDRRAARTLGTTAVPAPDDRTATRTARRYRHPRVDRSELQLRLRDRGPHGSRRSCRRSSDPCASRSSTA